MEGLCAQGAQTQANSGTRVIRVGDGAAFVEQSKVPTDWWSAELSFMAMNNTQLGLVSQETLGMMQGESMLVTVAM